MVYSWQSRRGRAWLMAAFVAAFPFPQAVAVTPDSPEVQALVEKGLAYLEKHNDERLGGKCLVGLAFFKAGRPLDHPRIREALDACQTMLASETEVSYVYSKALAAIFLTEIGAETHRELIQKYVALFKPHRKSGGGFGYFQELDRKGDTSQTQYVALSYWELMRIGIRPDVDEVEGCLQWILNTQDPTGVWGYMGNESQDGQLVAQTQTSPCMLSAGLSSALIFSNMLGLLTPGSDAQGETADAIAADRQTPSALKRAGDKARREAVKLQPTGRIDRSRLLAATESGRKWLDGNFSVDNHGHYPCYYLYALERYKSFEAYLEGDDDPSPKWYQAGYEFLKKEQQPEGKWSFSGESEGPECATALGILFLLRSTQQSIKASLGEGTLVGGRGLPRDLSRVRLSGGKLVVAQPATDVDSLLDMLNGSDAGAIDALIDSPLALQADQVSPEEARRLQQIVRSGSPEARLLAVRALSRMRSLDYVPTLIYGLTDPDRRVMRSANEGLRFVSRRFSGFGTEEDLEDAQRRSQIVEKWKHWYRTIRPDAPPLP